MLKFLPSTLLLLLGLLIGCTGFRESAARPVDVHPEIAAKIVNKYLNCSNPPQTLIAASDIVRSCTASDKNVLVEYGNCMDVNYCGLVRNASAAAKETSEGCKAAALRASITSNCASLLVK